MNPFLGSAGGGFVSSALIPQITSVWPTDAFAEPFAANIEPRKKETCLLVFPVLYMWASFMKFVNYFRLAFDSTSSES